MPSNVLENNNLAFKRIMSPKEASVYAMKFDFNTWVKMIYKDKVNINTRDYFYFYDQMYFLTENNKILVDNIIRFEELDESLS